MSIYIPPVLKPINIMLNQGSKYEIRINKYLIPDFSHTNLSGWERKA